MAQKTARHNKILIIDDSTVIRDRLTDRLENHVSVNYVSQTGAAAEAVSIFKKEKPDVVILDIQFPDGSGIDILADIKKEKTRAKVIILTNYPYSVIRKRCLDLGAEYFFDKSTEFEKVFEIIEAVN